MFVELNMVIPERQRHIYDEVEVETNQDDGEDDGIVQLHPAQQEATTSAIVNTAHIKSFYKRKKRSDGTTPVGTRINFVNGSGMAVVETYEQVKANLGVA